MPHTVTPKLSDGSITLHSSATGSWPLSNDWLRDNCRCSACRHPGNGQKLYGISDLPEGLGVRSAVLTTDEVLQVVWSDGHRSAYPQEWLAAHDWSATTRANRAQAVTTWGSDITRTLPAGDWPAMVADPACELAWLEQYHALGFGLLRNVPIRLGSVAEVGDRLGFVRVTNYGRLFDVVSVPNPTNLAYTAVGLGVHSDNPYRDPSPGVQLLHCLVSEAPGGDTLLVDGFAAADILRQQEPAAFDLLTRWPMTFRYADADTELVARQTLISVDTHGAVRSVHFNNRSADWLDAPAEIAASWYSAYRQFAAILQRSELQAVFRLDPGDCVVMQNDRTLHGRTAFDPQRGRRHLQGCYIDGDAMRSRLQVLRRGATATQEQV